jgi:hypothetical protein
MPVSRLYFFVILIPASTAPAGVASRPVREKNVKTMKRGPYWLHVFIVLSSNEAP